MNIHIPSCCTITTIIVGADAKLAGILPEVMANTMLDEVFGDKINVLGDLQRSDCEQAAA